jgi:hypothetical protein
MTPTQTTILITIIYVVCVAALAWVTRDRK